LCAGLMAGVLTPEEKDMVKSKMSTWLPQS
jgi:hypothetical protein